MLVGNFLFVGNLCLLILMINLKGIGMIDFLFLLLANFLFVDSNLLQ